LERPDHRLVWRASRLGPSQQCREPPGSAPRTTPGTSSGDVRFSGTARAVTGKTQSFERHGALEEPFAEPLLFGLFEQMKERLRAPSEGTRSRVSRSVALQT